jgi:hypothetical protein
MLVTVLASSRQHAGAILARALEFVSEVKVRNVSGTEDCFEVSFDAAVVMNEAELDAVMDGAEYSIKFPIAARR